MAAIRTGLLALGLLAALPGSGPATGDDPKEKTPAKKHRGKFTIGKDTTYVSGPLDKDGYVDYAAALNERLGKGVTPANNANVLLWKALGPHPEGKTMPAEFFQLLGIEAPPEKGEYFIDLSRYVKEQLKIDAAEEGDEIQDQLRRATQRPWTPKDYPNLAAWLKANEKPLAVAIEATKRSHFFSPLVPPKTETDKRLAGLIGAPLPTVQECRRLASALAARAMLRASQDAAEDAWQDLLACHRLGRLVGRGATLVEGLAGYAIDSTACRADLAFLERTKPDAKRIESCLCDLHKLSPLPGTAEKLDLGERFLFLDTVLRIDRHGDLMGTIRLLEGLSSQTPQEADTAWKILLQDIDWDPALRVANRWYDRLSLALAEKDRGPREKRLNQIQTEVLRLKAEIVTGEATKKIINDKSSRGKVVGDILVSVCGPPIHGVHNTADRAQQTQDNLLLAFALARYQREHGKYPKELAALAPKYLERIPPDLFSGKAPIYRPTEDGYLLYSVGVNGKDEDGRGSEDEAPGDDLSVRIPLPELRPK